MRINPVQSFTNYQTKERSKNSYQPNFKGEKELEAVRQIMYKHGMATYVVDSLKGHIINMFKTHGFIISDSNTPIVSILRANTNIGKVVVKDSNNLLYIDINKKGVKGLKFMLTKNKMSMEEMNPAEIQQLSAVI